MQRVTNAINALTNAVTADPLGASDTSKKWKVDLGCLFTLSISGTWAGNHATLQHSPTGLDADFIDYAPEGTALTFTQNDIRAIWAQGQVFRIVTDATGAPAIHVDVEGDGLVIQKS